MQLERSFKFMRETEDQLRIIPQFCFPDANDWEPVESYSRWDCKNEGAAKNKTFFFFFFPDDQNIKIPKIY